MELSYSNLFKLLYFEQNMSERRITLQRPINEKSSLELELAIHLYQNGVVIVNYPGITGDIEGFNNKYRQQANFIQEKGL